MPTIFNLCKISIPEFSEESYVTKFLNTKVKHSSIQFNKIMKLLIIAKVDDQKFPRLFIGLPYIFAEMSNAF